MCVCLCQVPTFERSIGDSSTPTPPSHIISSTSSLVALSLDGGNPRMAPQIWESYRAPLSIQLVADAPTSSQGGGGDDDDAGDDGDDKDDGAGDDDEDDNDGGDDDDGNGNGGIGDDDDGGGGPMMLMMMTGHVHGW